MDRDIKLANLVLGGGGVLGIAYIGMLEVAEERGFYFKNIAGVSAGALVGAFIGAGYNSCELKRILDEFDFNKMKLSDISREIPVVKKYMEYSLSSAFRGNKSFKDFLNMPVMDRGKHYSSENNGEFVEVDDSIYS